MADETFAAYLVSQDDAGALRGAVTRQPVSALPPGDVLVRVAWSAINYKDALSAGGRAGVTRKFPHVPGIDAAGAVVESNSPAIRVGSEVLVTGFDLGQNTWGGFAELIRVPAEWVVPLPAGLSLRESMIYGTAGLTAGIALEALERNGVTPTSGEVVVTGAGGGVGSLAIAILAKAGYQPVAVSGRPEQAARLRELGAVRVIGREEVIDTSERPLLSARFAGAIDTVAGPMLGTIIRSLAPRGCAAVCGLVGGTDVPLTVFPLIIRGVTIAGIDSPQYPAALRPGIWQKLAGPWKPPQLAGIASEEITLAELPDRLQKIMQGQTTGRVLVRIAK